MGVRIGGSLGPIHASMPLRAPRGSSSGLAALVVLMLQLCWWMLYACFLFYKYLALGVVWLVKQTVTVWQHYQQNRATETAPAALPPSSDPEDPFPGAAPEWTHTPAVDVPPGMAPGWYRDIDNQWRWFNGQQFGAGAGAGAWERLVPVRPV